MEPVNHVARADGQGILFADGAVFDVRHVVIGQQLDLFRADFLQECAGAQNILVVIVESGNQRDTDLNACAVPASSCPRCSSQIRRFFDNRRS